MPRTYAYYPAKNEGTTIDATTTQKYIWISEKSVARYRGGRGNRMGEPSPHNTGGALAHAASVLSEKKEGKNLVTKLLPSFLNIVIVELSSACEGKMAEPSCCCCSCYCRHSERTDNKTDSKDLLLEKSEK